MFLSGSGAENDSQRTSSNNSSPRSLTSPRGSNSANSSLQQQHHPNGSHANSQNSSEKLVYSTKLSLISPSMTSTNGTSFPGSNVGSTSSSSLNDESDRILEFRASIQHLTFTEIYEKIERQHEEQKELLKLYCPRLFDELKITNEKLFSILVWIFTQIPLSQKYSKRLKKNFEKVFTAKTFVSLVTSQLHKISLPYFPNIIATPKSNADILDKLKNLYRSINNTLGDVMNMNINNNNNNHNNHYGARTTTSILAPQVSHSSLTSPRQQASSLPSTHDTVVDNFSFKNDWTKVQAELLGQFFLEIGVIENIKPEKKKKFTERSHRYMFHSETIEYYADLLFVSAITSAEQRQVFEHWKMFIPLKTPFSQFAHDFYSPFLSGISTGSMQLLTAGQLVQQCCLRSIIVSQEKDFELVQNHIKKLQESVNHDLSPIHENSSPRDANMSSLSTIGTTLSTSSAYPLVFRNVESAQQQLRTKDMSKTETSSPFMDRRSFRMSAASSGLKAGWESQSLIGKRLILESGMGDYEMQSPRTKFYEQHGIRAKVENLQQALVLPSVLEEFSKFCVTNHIEEIVNCWKAIQSYMKMESAKDRKDQALYILNQFIDDSSPNATPINLDSETREQVLSKIQSNLENFAFFTKDLFSAMNVELILLNDLKEPFMNFNQKRNQEIDLEIDGLQEKLRIRAIQEEKSSKSFLSQVVGALKKKPSTSTTIPASSNTSSSSGFLNSPNLTDSMELMTNSNKLSGINRSQQQINSPVYPEMEKLPVHLYGSLPDVLTHRDAIKQFKVFCTSEHCEEYVLFYEAVEEFRTLPTQQERIQKAKEIFETFIEIP
ncbi:hypothetical protein C9374_010496 [Naegleria lovaniensis]|uniref:RGS domain-containing protein n=1 Tax=Naegleria lovaniensis TaxID=51637 RepID=A0AA88KJC1_NAELO|nr:uncharacterized protein C9374_010496 [Naegleria lovaniensis]KAG2374752.1 hypothetical protein C9374_010496 [Naegleria lovaniensis]